VWGVVERIVVGVDGSDGSKAALRWAVAEARLHQATVLAVQAWEAPVVVATPVGVVPPFGPVDTALRAAADSLLAEAVAAVPADGVTVESTVVEGPAGGVLCEASAAAALLVVGASGHGRVAEALIGSVSHYCTRHAPCPVVVVRH
jgi:nucleotide-binding universal stress UspA family protein